MYERDMKQYQKDKFWSDVALGATSPFIAVNQFVVGSGECICNLVIHPVQSTKAMWNGIWTSDPSKNIITAPMHGIVTQAGPLVRGELSAEELVDYQVNVFNTAMIAYGGAKTADFVGSNVSKLAKTPRLATIKGTVSNVKYQKASLWERLTVRKINPSELSPSPLDDISNPKIGPSPTALSKHIMYINQNGTINGPIEVQKLASGGYEIVNGHHRWLAAIKTGLDEVPIIIKNYNN